MDALYQSLTLFGLGFVLGLKHALDADHVVALTTFVSQTRSLKKSSLIGITWGLGHTLTLFLVGLAILVFKLTIPEKVALSFEFLVGIVLIVLGANVVRKAWQDKIHIHEHTYEADDTHIHLHTHSQSPLHNHTHASFGVGMIHGLAGSAALVLLALTTVQSVFQGIVFILIFGAGSILGMFLTTTIIAYPLQFIGQFDRINQGIKVVAGVASLVVGLFLMYEVGFVYGLLVR